MYKIDNLVENFKNDNSNVDTKVNKEVLTEKNLQQLFRQIKDSQNNVTKTIEKLEMTTQKLLKITEDIINDLNK